MKPIERLALGWRTQLLFARFDGEVADRGDHLLVRSPASPTFWWGNFLLYEQPPRAGDAASWTAAFEREISAQQPESTHAAFGIDAGGDFELPPDFAAAGFAKQRTATLVLEPDMIDTAAPPLGREIQIRAAELPARSEHLVELDLAVDAGAHPEPGYRVFRERQLQRFAAMQDAGLGHWFGAYARTPQGERLVASCGLFRERRGSGGVARFRDVGTHPDWRGRGIATALVHRVCRHGFEVMGDAMLVIGADPAGAAIRVYEAIGFERERDLYSLERSSSGA